MATTKALAKSAPLWGLVALLFAGSALNYVDRQVVALLKPTLEAHFHWNDRDYAHLGSAFQLASAAALLFVGVFVDRVGVRVAYAAAVIVWSFAGMGHALARTVEQFVAARVILAVGETVTTPAAVKASALYFTLEQRNQAIGIVNAAPNIGAILTPLIIPPLALAFGWQSAFWVTGGLGLVWLAAWWMNTGKLQPVATVAERAPVRWADLLADRRSWAVIGAKFLTDFVWFFVLFWMPDFFNRNFAMDQGHLGRPVALVFSLAAVGSLVSGWLYPWLLSRGCSPATARKRSMLFFALSVLVMPLALATHNPWLAAFAIGIGLFAHQGFSTNLFGLASTIVPLDRLARVIALGAIAGNLSGTGMIELAGWSLQNGFGYAPMFALCACAYLAALGWIVAVLREDVA
ncbi:MAG: MFS transporter [Pseudomonadota bacterium]|nr:MFS transporter [Pseudomonadota bacterium]